MPDALCHCDFQICFAFTLALLFTTSVLAQGPTRTPLNNQPFTVAAGRACAFPPHGEPLIDQEVVKTFPPDANGDVRQIITGRLVFELSNLDTGKSLVVNVSGPATLIFHPDGSHMDEIEGGSGPLIFSPTDIPPGSTAFINSGRIAIDATSTGQFIVVSQSGHEQDVCAALL
jgi:hypothetical protein